MYPSKDIFIALGDAVEPLMRKLFRHENWRARVAGRTTDADIYAALTPSKAVSVENTDVNKFRVAARVREFTELFEYALPPGKKMLDFGSSTGVLTSGIAHHFGFRASATDIAEWHGEAREQRFANVRFQVLKEDGRIPFRDRFDLIVCLMVLHHCPPDRLDAIIADIAAHLTPGGVVILREHDVRSETTRNLCHVEHALHDALAGRTFEEFKIDYRATYKSSTFWRARFARKFLFVHKTRPYGPTAYQYLVFRLRE
jgi:SAM-dependent methyltransferase